MKMFYSQFSTFLLTLCVSTVFADFLGPTYPPPIDLTSDESAVSQSWKTLTATLDRFVKDPNSAPATTLGLENVTFSIEMFSLYDPAATKLQYHYTAPEIATAKNGTNAVDGDSIYKIASVSKLFTVFAAQLKLSDADWDRPLSDIFPILANYSREDFGGNDPIYAVQWDKITPLALASQIAGISSLGVLPTDVLLQEKISADAGEPGFAAAQGFPPLDFGVLGPCQDEKNLFCKDAPDDFLETIRSQTPSFLPWTSPGYTQSGYMILGLIMSKITGDSLDTIYRESIFDPLGMKSTYATVPQSEDEIARGVIAGEPSLGFAADAGVTLPSGGILSTANDLAKFGVGILNSTLLSDVKTRKWMKPVTNTASTSYAVGAPWEIIHYVHPTTGKVTEIYTKSGDSGPYGAMLVTIPDYDAGFAMLNAYTNSTVRGAASFGVLDLVTEAVLPALEAQAAFEANQNYVGTYVSTDKDLNSSVIITFNNSTTEGATGALKLSSWISNGTDVLATTLFNGVQPRLLPSIPNQSEGPGKVAFQTSTRGQFPSYSAAELGPFSGYYSNFGWFVVNNRAYGGIAINLFVFDVDAEGNATAVSPAAMRVSLKKEGW